MYCSCHVKWYSHWKIVGSSKSYTRTDQELAIPFQYIYSKELKAGTQTGICTPITLEALLTIAKSWKKLNVHQLMDGYNKMMDGKTKLILFNLKKE